MTIKGLTDNVVPRFPRLGKLRKGGPKSERGFGADLDHFRFTSENEAIAEAFTQAYGERPALIRCYLPHHDLDDNLSTWREAWVAGGLQHRCDGETQTIWRTPEGTYSTEPRACNLKNCKPVGRLEIIVPELWQAGYVGYVTLETHSLHDLMNWSASLRATEQAGQGRGLQGIQFVLRRAKVKVSCPDGKGGRVTRAKWLVSLEPSPDWVTLQLQAARAQQGTILQLPDGRHVEVVTGEIIDDGQHDPEFIEAEVVDEVEDEVEVDGELAPDPENDSTVPPEPNPEPPPPEPPPPEPKPDPAPVERVKRPKPIAAKEIRHMVLERIATQAERVGDIPITTQTRTAMNDAFCALRVELVGIKLVLSYLLSRPVIAANLRECEAAGIMEWLGKARVTLSDEIDAIVIAAETESEK